MKYRRKQIEMAIAVLILVSSCVFLIFFGRANRLMLPSPRIEQIAEPHEAFRVWERYGVHGRILVLMDRYLNAAEAEHGTFEFTPDEFAGDYTKEALCAAISNDDYGIDVFASECTIESLNALLKTQDFHHALQRKRKNIALPIELLNKVRSMRGAVINFAALPDEWKGYVIEVNRKILELTYPGVTPKKSTWPFVGSDNYVYKAIREGYVRKIYHVIPESAWPEVEKTLRPYKLVTASGGTFRMAIESFTQVIILRLRDLPSFPEEVLLSVNSVYWSDAELDALTEMMRHDRLKSDLITISGPVSARTFEVLGGQR